MKYINFWNMIFSSHFLTIFPKDDVYKCKTIGGRGDRDVGFHYPLLDMLYKSESELGLSPSGSFLVVSSSRMLKQRNELRFRMGWWWCLMLTMRRWCDDDVNRRNTWMYRPHHLAYTKPRVDWTNDIQEWKRKDTIALLCCYFLFTKRCNQISGNEP